MKGVILVKFSEFIEQTWGDEFWDQLLLEADLPSEGIYTSASTVDDQELYALIGLVVEKKGITGEQAQKSFGTWLFSHLLEMAPPDAHNFSNVF